MEEIIIQLPNLSKYGKIRKVKYIGFSHQPLSCTMHLFTECTTFEDDGSVCLDFPVKLIQLVATNQTRINPVNGNIVATENPSVIPNPLFGTEVEEGEPEYPETIPNPAYIPTIGEYDYFVAVIHSGANLFTEIIPAVILKAEQNGRYANA